MVFTFPDEQCEKYKQRATFKNIVIPLYSNIIRKLFPYIHKSLVQLQYLYI
jgi:hypothetical protein